MEATFVDSCRKVSTLAKHVIQEFDYAEKSNSSITFEILGEFIQSLFF